MYLPPHFLQQDPAELMRFLRAFPLGTLVTSGGDGLDANHIPFEFDSERGVLSGHVARSNPVWREPGNGANVLVIFHGPQGYISPNWYPSKHDAHRQVPTWNYEVVHAHGVMSVHDDERFVRGVVARLTRRHEAQEPKPWRMGDSAPEYIDGMLRAIVGIEVAVSRMVGKSKLSQNRELRDREGATLALREREQIALAKAMQSASDQREAKAADT